MVKDSFTFILSVNSRTLLCTLLDLFAHAIGNSVVSNNNILLELSDSALIDVYRLSDILSDYVTS